MENEKDFIDKVKAEVSAKITEMLDTNAAKHAADLNEKMKSAVTKEEIEAVKTAIEQLSLDMKANAEQAHKKDGTSAKEQVVSFLGKEKTNLENLAKNKSG